MKIVNIKGENLQNDMRNFNEIFRKYVVYDYIIKVTKKHSHTLSRKHIFGKTTGKGEDHIDTPAFLGLIDIILTKI